jgi:hypothetical protein
LAGPVSETKKRGEVEDPDRAEPDERAGETYHYRPV